MQRTSLVCFHAVSRWARDVESALTLRHVCVSVSCLLTSMTLARPVVRHDLPVDFPFVDLWYCERQLLFNKGELLHHLL